jgi:fibronectin type III domain protein
MRAGKTRNARRLGAVVLAASALLFTAPQLAGAAQTGPPSAPRSLRTTPGNARATVRWHPPDHLNGYPVNRWRMVAYDAGNNPLPTREFAGQQTTYVYPGLRNAKWYTFTVQAKNRKGWSPLSARSAPVRIGVPLAPGKPTAAPGVGRATVSWKTPGNNGATVKAYRVTTFVAGHAVSVRTFTSPKTSQVLTGLKPGKRYSFAVAAHNNRGWSARSNPSATIFVK